ncbi:MAG: amino acid adenylation domain-containing protein, partial [Chloroflexi bacterium]|nr:amino acid adenylation domain-containing protein [Chloroflexota bacterium]
QPERNLTHTPLFQVMFVLQNAPTPEMALPGLCLTSLPIDTATATFDLTLTLQETGAGLSGAWEYNTDLFDAATIAQLTSHLRVLLDGVLLNPDQPIDDLPLLAEHERQQLLVEWNATSTGDPREACIHQLFEAQAARTPAALAVIDPARSMSMTYAELDQRTNQLAHYLQRMGVGPETLVGLFAERSVEMLVGILGVLKAGGAYVPLDPQYPGERLSFMLEDSRARLLLTQQALLDRLPARDTHVVCLDDDWPAIAQEPARTIGGMANADQLAYVIYTSGSTGQPKGVCVTHRSVVNHNRAVARAFGLQAADRVLQFASMSFDAAVEEIFPTLACGACLVLRSAGVAPGSDELIQLIQSTRITVLDLPTAYWQTWVSSLKLTGATWPDSVRLVVVGGEAASSEAYATWRALAGPGVRWLNTYGPTEATVISTLYEAHGQAQTDMSIGRPIANTRLYLLDEYRRPVPVGMPGELYLGGVAVARGYLNQPHLTAERFIPDPFGPQIELGNQTVPAFLYKTGDLARYRRDGNVVFLGRTDDQVKIRGFRVELGEIETALSRHPGIRDVAVIPHETQTGKQLVAYIVSTGNQTDALVLAAFTDELRAHLKARLPEYMLPSAFVLLDALPLTPSGKLDRHTLPTPDVQAEYRDTYLPPRTPVERTLAGIWARVLGLQQVGVRDNFFALGGDSILSIQVIARANQAGLWLTARQLFEHPTVEGLAAIAVLTPPATKHCEQGIVQGLVPLTPIQHWFFDQDLPEPQHWNQSVLLEAQTPLSRSPLEAAFAQLVIHHDALRLRCSGTEPGFLQISAETDSGKVLEWVDLSTLSEYEQALAVQAKTTQAQASLSLYEGPLLRAIYFNLGPGRSDRLFVTIHHLAVDGVSWRILLEDLQTAYEQLQRGESVSLPPKTTSFRYWAHRLAEHAQTETLRQEQGYWLRSIDAPDGHLPSIEGAEGRANTEATARSVSVSLSSEETRAILQDIPAVYGTEINDILLTAMVWAFAQSTGSQVLLVDLEGHGREDILDDVDLSRTVGWFTTMFPVWLDIRNATTLRTALMAIKEQLRQIPQHGIGYGLLRYLRNEQDIGKRLLAQPRAEVSFNYLGQFDQALAKSVLFQYAREPVGPSRNLTGQRGHLLEVNGAIIERQLRVEWTYSEALHQRTAIEEVASDFVEALRLLIVHCESPEAGGYTPSDFPDAELSQSEIDALLAETSTA